jgi:putative transposase
LPHWREWSTRDPLTERAMAQMVLGVSTRRYARSLEALPPTANVRGVSKSAVSERFVYGTERQLAAVMSRELNQFSLTVVFINGVHCAEHVVLAAVGWMSMAKSMCSACARMQAKMGQHAKRCWQI